MSHLLQSSTNCYPFGSIDGYISSAKHSYGSAYEKSEIIENYLAEELADGTLSGPFSCPLFQGTPYKLLWGNSKIYTWEIALNY